MAPTSTNRRGRVPDGPRGLRAVLRGRVPSDENPWLPDARGGRVPSVTDLTHLLAAYDDQLRTDAETPGRVVGHPARPAAAGHLRRRPRLHHLPGPRRARRTRLRQLVGARRSTTTARTPRSARWSGRPAATTTLPACTTPCWRPASRRTSRSRSCSARRAPSPSTSSLPEGVTLRTVTDEADVRAMSAMVDEVFGDPVSDAMADSHLRRLWPAATGWSSGSPRRTGR